MITRNTPEYELKTPNPIPWTPSPRPLFDPLPPPLLLQSPKNKGVISKKVRNYQ